jgi:hypothetical protein
LCGIGISEPERGEHPIILSPVECTNAVARYTTLSVNIATDGMLVEVNNVYVLPGASLHCAE